MKYNLILIHSFPTNSILLKGLIEYLEGFFNVYFIDLPGFRKTIPPLALINIPEYAKFVENKIAGFGLDSYLVGGISFGFIVINSVKYTDGKCLGIIAMEPFTGVDSLRMTTQQKTLYKMLFRVVNFLKVDKLLWKSLLLRRTFAQQYPEWTVDIVLGEIDSKTFFETAALILNATDPIEFQNLPYVLSINKDDDTVNYPYLHKLFSTHVKRLKIIDTSVEHYPADLSKDYFSKMIPSSVFMEIFSFLAQLDLDKS